MINGGVKFFKRSQCLLIDGTDINASSNDASSANAIDRNPLSYWRSGSSDDTVMETLTIVFEEMKTFSRLLLLDHNWKDYDIMYDNSGVWTHFASVVGMDGAKANITETTFADDSSYYEFAEVTTLAVRIQVTKTQIVDDQKYINQIIITEEIGTLNGFPKLKGTESDRNIRKKEMLSGKILIQKSEESFKCELSFQDYPSAAPYSNDIELMFRLHDMEDNFIIWLCGGRRGSVYFRGQFRGYRLRDAMTVQLVAPLQPVYSANLYKGPVSMSAKFEEVVD